MVRKSIVLICLAKSNSPQGANRIPAIMKAAVVATFCPLFFALLVALPIIKATCAEQLDPLPMVAKVFHQQMLGFIVPVQRYMYEKKFFRTALDSLLASPLVVENL